MVCSTRLLGADSHRPHRPADTVRACARLEEAPLACETMRDLVLASWNISEVDVFERLGETQDRLLDAATTSWFAAAMALTKAPPQRVAVGANLDPNEGTLAGDLEGTQNRECLAVPRANTMMRFSDLLKNGTSTSLVHALLDHDANPRHAGVRVVRGIDSQCVDPGRHIQSCA